MKFEMDHGALETLNAHIAPSALAPTAARVETGAKRLCPVDTGRLRGSINTVFDKDEEGPVAYVGTDTRYAAYQELGTRFMPAQPYLRPALHAAGNAR